MTDLETVRPPASSLNTRPSAPGQDEPTIPLTGIALVLAIAGLLLFMAVPSRPLDAASLAAERVEQEFDRALGELRGAISEYHGDHDVWPGAEPAHVANAVAAAGSPDARFVRQLELFTDESGTTMPRRLSTHSFGPYLTHGVPVNPLNGSSRVRILGAGEQFPDEPAGPWGWIYSPTTGEVRANVAGFLPGSGRRIFEL